MVETPDAYKAPGYYMLFVLKDKTLSTSGDWKISFCYKVCKTFNQIMNIEKILLEDKFFFINDYDSNCLYCSWPSLLINYDTIWKSEMDKIWLNRL